MIKTNYSLMDYRKNKYEPLRKIIAEKRSTKNNRRIIILD